MGTEHMEQKITGARDHPETGMGRATSGKHISDMDKVKDRVQ
jgi:hypothetical protein